MKTERARALAQLFRRGPLWPLLGLALVAGAAWTFVELADEVQEGETRVLDERILLALRSPHDPTDPLGPRWVEEMGRDLTALGGTAVLTLMTLAAVGYFLLLRSYRLVALTLFAVVGGQLVSLALKDGFDRPRPQLVPHGSFVLTSSFPSGHSMMAAVTYLSLAALLVRTQQRAAMRAYLVAFALLLTLLVGVSRVYLGVHYPTDVLAGWVVGAGWAATGWLLAYWLPTRSGRTQTTTEPEA